MDKIKLFLSGLIKKGNRKPIRRAWPRAERDWKFLLSAFFLLLIFGGIGGAFLFKSISRGEIFRVEQPAQDQTFVIDQDLLDKTIHFYENKAQNLDEITTHSKTLVDPSM